MSDNFSDKNCDTDKHYLKKNLIRTNDNGNLKDNFNLTIVAPLILSVQADYYCTRVSINEIGPCALSFANSIHHVWVLSPDITIRRDILFFSSLFYRVLSFSVDGFTLCHQVVDPKALYVSPGSKR